MTTIATIVKATSTTLNVFIEGSGPMVINNPVKGVPGQLAKLGDLIGCLSGSQVVINAGKLPGVFKAFREDSKDLNEFLERFDKHQIIRGTVIVLHLGDREVIISKGEYDVDNLPKNANQESIKGLEVAVQCFDQMSTDEIEALIDGHSLDESEGVQTLLIELERLLEGRYASNGTKVPERVVEESEEPSGMICDLLLNSWLLSRDSWDTSKLRSKLITTWKSRPEITSKRQGEILKEFFKRAPSGVVSSIELINILGEIYSD